MHLKFIITLRGGNCPHFTSQKTVTQLFLVPEPNQDSNQAGQPQSPLGTSALCIYLGAWGREGGRKNQNSLEYSSPFQYTHTQRRWFPLWRHHQIPSHCLALQVKMQDCSFEGQYFPRDTWGSRGKRGLGTMQEWCQAALESEDPHRALGVGGAVPDPSAI